MNLRFSAMERAVAPDTSSTFESPLALQEQAITRYRFGLRVFERGELNSVGDGIAWIKGLPSARIEELLTFEDGSDAVVFCLLPDVIGAIMLRQTNSVKAGTGVLLSGRNLDVGVGDPLLGRVIDPLGRPLDGQRDPVCVARRALDVKSPRIVERDFVTRPLYTGSKIVDTMLPIGKGQRQLIIGDNGTGKSALALDAVVHQRGRNVRCVYVLIGQKRSTVVQTVNILRRNRALDYSTVVVAEATATPGLKYLAPFAGCAIAEEWTHSGHDTLIVYDDLTTHARSYRELSLLLRRAPGREAFPGDIFYLHARLLERSIALAASRGGGSMTALPIVETEEGEIAAYIPTNLISITDGQIYLDPGLFARGVRPAIDITRSVSRIGGKAQTDAIKREAGRMKLDYLQFLELEVFTRFGAKLEASMQERIARGQLLREILKQQRLDPLPIEYHLAWLVAFNEGMLNGLQKDTLENALQNLRRGVDQSALTLNAERRQWVDAVRAWLSGDPV